VEALPLVAPLSQQLGAGLSALAVSVLVALKCWRASGRLERGAAFALALTGMLLVSPITWDHYLLMLLLPLALVWTRLPPVSLSRGAFLAALVVLFLTPRPVYEALIPGGANGVALPWQTVAVLSLQGYALLAVFAMVFGVKARHSGGREKSGLFAPRMGRSGDVQHP
jgi:hypothetical protein